MSKFEELHFFSTKLNPIKDGLFISGSPEQYDFTI